MIWYSGFCAKGLGAVKEVSLLSLGWHSLSSGPLLVESISEDKVMAFEIANQCTDIKDKRWGIPVDQPFSSLPFVLEHPHYRPRDNKTFYPKFDSSDQDLPSEKRKGACERKWDQNGTDGKLTYSKWDGNGEEAPQSVTHFQILTNSRSDTEDISSRTT